MLQKRPNIRNTGVYRESCEDMPGRGRPHHLFQRCSLAERETYLCSDSHTTPRPPPPPPSRRRRIETDSRGSPWNAKGGQGGEEAKYTHILHLHDSRRPPGRQARPPSPFCPNRGCFHSSIHFFQSLGELPTARQETSPSLLHRCVYSYLGCEIRLKFRFILIGINLCWGFV